MLSRLQKPGRPISLIWYLISLIALIIGIVVAGVLFVSYIQAKEEIEYDYAIRTNNTEENVIGSVWLVNKGLTLLDENLDPVLKQSFGVFLDEYNQSGGDPSRMNLSEVRLAIEPAYSGDVNLYIINADGVIEYTTLPDVQGVDFRKFPDFYRSLTRIRLGSDFSADPVVRSVRNASDTAVAGTLRKFAYLPTPDHQYVLEIGVENPDFADVRSRYSYQQMADRLLAINPDLTGIRVYDYYGNLAAEAGLPGDEGRQLADMARTNRTSLSVQESGTGTWSRYIFVDLNEPGAASDTSVVVELRFSTARLDATLANLVLRYLLIGLIAVIMGIGLAYAMFRKLTGSINEIVIDVEQIADGDLEHTIRNVNTAEFAKLESGINTMVKKIRVYTEELERKKAELKVAADIQDAFLPNNIPHPAHFDLSALSIPAREVGGDFYDVIHEEDQARYALVVADVAGKGVPASLFMALSRTAVRIISRWEKTPQRVVENSNTTFIKDAGSTSFVTLFYAILDERSRTLTYVNAGHNPPLLCRADATLEELLPTGPVIGLLDTPAYREGVVTMGSGDMLVMYTDGVTEAMNGEGELFSDDRLREIVIAGHTESAQAMVERIRTEVASFCGSAPQSDDITIMVLKAI